MVNVMVVILFFQIMLESFPVSSSGHILLIEKFLYRGGFPKISLPDSIDYFLHGPTILILILLFRREWGAILKQLIFRPSKSFLKILLKIFLYICITTSIAGCFKFFIDLYLKNFSWFKSDQLLLIGFCLTATLLFILFMKEKREDNNFAYNKLTIKKVFIVGIVQALALLPGISRFGSVYVVSRLLNISPRRAFEFTFLIQMPLIIPAFLWGTFKLLRLDIFNDLFSLKIFIFMLIATVIAYFALRFMQQLAYKKRIGLFCFYMLIPIFILILFG